MKNMMKRKLNLPWVDNTFLWKYKSFSRKSVTHLLWLSAPHDTMPWRCYHNSMVRRHWVQGRWQQAAGKEVTGGVPREIKPRLHPISWFLLWLDIKRGRVNSISQRYEARGHLLQREKSGLYALKAEWLWRLELKEISKEFNRRKCKTACSEISHRHFCCELWGYQSEMSEKEEQWCSAATAVWLRNARVVPATRKPNAAAKPYFQYAQEKLMT